MLLGLAFPNNNNATTNNNNTPITTVQTSNSEASTGQGMDGDTSGGSGQRPPLD
ncbi:hypothetical protein [Chryseobacterium sp. CT-SW4]|uniref:hypothetical protein n=1 Tax=Chryseobacterium sp. SW-1 TaxID=3157343 RepID=UPI003B01839A